MLSTFQKPFRKPAPKGFYDPRTPRTGPANSLHITELIRPLKKLLPAYEFEPPVRSVRRPFITAPGDLLKKVLSVFQNTVNNAPVADSPIRTRMRDREGCRGVGVALVGGGHRVGTGSGVRVPTNPIARLRLR